MIEREVTLPTIALIAGTRLPLGVGIGLLAARRLSSEQRQAAGWALVAIGVLTTVPLVAQVFGAKEVPGDKDGPPDTNFDVCRSRTAIA